MYLHLRFTSIYRPLSYPFRSLDMLPDGLSIHCLQWPWLDQSRPPWLSGSLLWEHFWPPGPGGSDLSAPDAPYHGQPENIVKKSENVISYIGNRENGRKTQAQWSKAGHFAKNQHWNSPKLIIYSENIYPISYKTEEFLSFQLLVDELWTLKHEG